MRIANRSSGNSGLLAVTVHHWCYLYSRVVIPVAPWCSPSKMVAYVSESGMIVLGVCEGLFQLVVWPPSVDFNFYYMHVCMYMRKFVCTTRLIVLENTSMNQ